jgi:hypothetical protein
LLALFHCNKIVDAFMQQFGGKCIRTIAAALPIFCRKLPYVSPGLGVLSKMPVSRLVAERAFDLAHIKAICDAFDGAWTFLAVSQSPLASDALVNATREVLAKRIIEMAERGMRDSEKLQADALNFLRSNPPEP